MTVNYKIKLTFAESTDLHLTFEGKSWEIELNLK